jgi:hypothetical protein
MHPSADLGLVSECEDLNPTAQTARGIRRSFAAEATATIAEAMNEAIVERIRQGAIQGTVRDAVQKLEALSEQRRPSRRLCSSGQRFERP